ncbi:ras gtpase-activating protein [Anaeramoeba flamelloides]|uniref:Ras gtpase-activating protein n=1 Tax=Anaeramoeba flamelloides TaxID=1746091 RepID=A0ABQ8YVC3_9EUKA|nr:ras gtpase-activating protein [Anaeramoeba flamelloides]
MSSVKTQSAKQIAMSSLKTKLEEEFSVGHKKRIAENKNNNQNSQTSNKIQSLISRLQLDPEKPQKPKEPPKQTTKKGRSKSVGKVKRKHIISPRKKITKNPKSTPNQLFKLKLPQRSVPNFAIENTPKKNFDQKRQSVRLLFEKNNKNNFLAPLNEPKIKSRRRGKNARTTSFDITLINRPTHLKSLFEEKNEKDKKLSKEEKKKLKEQRKEEKKQKKIHEKEMKRNKKEEKKQKLLEKKKNKKNKNSQNSSSKVISIDLTGEQIITMILNKNFELIDLVISSIKRIKKSQEIIQKILNMFEIRSRTIDLLTFCLNHEISITKQGENLFRGNSFTTKLLTLCASLYAKQYIKNTLSLPFKNLLNDFQNLEIDKNKIQDPKIFEQNFEKMKLKTQLFLNAINGSISKSPIELRHICYLTRSIVKKTFPEMEIISVGSFIFLRIFCVFITSPSDIGIITEKIDPQARRASVQIAKIIQALANNVLFGEASYMNIFNDFILENKNPMKEFLEKMSDVNYLEIIKMSTPLIEENNLLSNANELKSLFEANHRIINDGLMEIKSSMFDQTMTKNL